MPPAGGLRPTVPVAAALDPRGADAAARARARRGPSQAASSRPSPSGCIVGALGSAAGHRPRPHRLPGRRGRGRARRSARLAAVRDRARSFVERIVAEPALRERYAGASRRRRASWRSSEMLAGELRAAFPEHAAKVEVLPNAVPVDAFRPAAGGRRVADQLLFVGYRKASKGHREPPPRRRPSPASAGPRSRCGSSAGPPTRRRRRAGASWRPSSASRTRCAFEAAREPGRGRGRDGHGEPSSSTRARGRRSVSSRSRRSPPGCRSSRPTRAA